MIITIKLNIDIIYMSVDFGDISDIEDNMEFTQDLSVDDSNFDDVMNETTRESISNIDLTNSDNTLELSELNNNITVENTNDTTQESELSLEGGKRRTRRRKSNLIKRKKTHRKHNKKTRKAHKKKSRKHNRKTRKVRRRKMSGGDVDSLGDVDFNQNLAFDKKAIGGFRQQGGQPVGSNCYDPNYSIYNTRALQLFPYKP
jgi:hypothetical protein